MKTALDLKNEGNHAYQAKNYEEAMALYRDALAIDGTLASAWHNIGQCHLHLNQPGEALDAFDQALDYRPDYPKATFGKAKALEQLGNLTASWQLLKNLLARDKFTGPLQQDAAQMKFQLEQEYQAKVVYACVDFKYTELGEIKLLEFGLGVQSALKGLNAISNKSFEQRMREVVHQEGLPSMFLNQYPGLYGGTRHDLLAQYIEETPPLVDGFDFAQLNHYELIYGGVEVRELADNVCLMDDANLRFVLGNKAYTHDALGASHLEEAFRPKTMIFPRRYTSDLVDRIRSEIPGDRYVIKAPDVERGNGVYIASEDELEDILRFILIPLGQLQSNPGVRSGVKPEMLERKDEFIFILSSSSERFMVEEFIPGRLINYHNEIYDPTIRSLFLYVRDGGVGRYVPLVSYWKIPPQPVSADHETLRARTVSSFGQTRVDAALVDAEDAANINNALSQIIPTLFNTIITTNYFTMISNMERSRFMRYGRDVQWLHYSNYLALHGNFNLAMYCLEEIVASEVVPCCLPHHRAIAYYAKGDVEQAIANFKEALRFDDTFASAYFRLARIYAELGNQEKYQEIYNASFNGLDPLSEGKWVNLLHPMPLFIAGSVTEDDESESKLSLEDQAEALKNQGNEHFKKNRFERAIVFYEKAIALNPSYKVAWLNKGRCHHELGVKELAVNAYKMAWQCDSENGDVKVCYFLTKLLYEHGDLRMADQLKAEGLLLAGDNATKRDFERLNAGSVSRNHATIWERKQVYTDDVVSLNDSQSLK